jgi:predicted MFS family arabinose efflux permease
MVVAPDTFGELLEPHRRALHLHCYRMLGSLEDAEDVVQETLLSAWRALDGFNGDAKLRTWLLAVSVALFAAFAAIEARVRSPLAPLRILRSRTLLGANAAMLLTACAAFGMPFILTLYARQVLGFSAVEFGLTSLVFPVMAAVGSITGQALVTRRGFAAVAALGMTLMGLAIAFLTQVSVNGSYFADMFPALVLFGAGLGLSFVASSIAALAGVAEAESGLASGLNNTAFQLGAALGVAVVTSVAVSATDAPSPAGLTEGFRAAFLACTAFPAAGLVLTLLLRGVRAPEPLTPATAVAGADR